MIVRGGALLATLRWHRHPDTHEAFIVIECDLHIDFRDGHARLAPAKCT